MDNNIKIDKKLFLKGCELIFGKWASFRTAIDYNPNLLSQFTDDTKEELEINQMLIILFNDIYDEMCIEKDDNLRVHNVSDILFCFFEEFFDVDLDDGSDIQVAKCFVKLVNELSEGKEDYLIKLSQKNKNDIKYAIDFPIVVNNIIKDFQNKLSLEESNQIIDEEGFVEYKKGKKF